jgi:hypothetical protein
VSGDPQAQRPRELAAQALEIKWDFGFPGGIEKAFEPQGKSRVLLTQRTRPRNIESLSTMRRK